MDQWQIERICEEYSANDMRKLRQIIDPIIKDFGKLNYAGEDSDYAEFLSDANLELVKILKTYDSEKCCNVHAYIRKRLPNKMYTVLTRLNRDVRMAYERDYKTGKKVLRDAEGKVTTDKKKGKATRIVNASLDYKDEEGHAVIETIDSGFDIETYLYSDAEFSPPMKLYLRLLSKLQREILFLHSRKYTKEAILQILHIDAATYNDNMKAITSANNTQYLNQINSRRRMYHG